MASLADIYDSLRTAIRHAGSQAEWARRHDVSPQYLSDVLNAKADPGPKILGPLGYQSRVTYHRSNHA